jgi:hypothetical protein
MATAAQIQAELAAGPQTQEALDAALLRYSPAEMAAAFPQFGNVADFNNATREAAQRVEQQTRIANRDAMRAEMAQTGEEVRVANPGGNVNVQGTPRPQMSAIPQSEVDAARARLTPEQQQFIDWQMQQINPLTAQRIGDEYARQGVNPYLNPQQAQEQIDRAGRREDVFAQAGIAPGDLRPWISDAPAPTPAPGRPAAPSPFVIGGGAPSQTVVGGGTVQPGGLLGGGAAPTAPAPGGGLLGGAAPAAPAAPVNPRIQAIQQWYNSNAGRTDPQAQGDLNRWLATSGFTAREINAALPQWGLNDLQNAMRTAIGEVAQQTPFAPVAAQPMQPLAQPYTSIASQLPGGADTRMQEIRNWYAANEGRGTQADLDRWLASGYTAQEINRALPQWGVADLDRAIATARQAFPQAEVQSGLAQYQNMAPGAQYVGAVSPYGLIMDQMQPFQNPYADTLANIPLGGYNPGVYNLLLDETIDPVTGMAIPNEGGAGGASGADGGGDGTGNAAAAAAASGSSAGADGGSGGTGIGEGGGTGMGGYAKGGLVDRVAGPNPAGPDDGAGMLDLGEYVIKKSSVKKYGAGLLDMINEGKIPAKKMKSLLG